MIDIALIDAYINAKCAHDASTAGTCRRVDSFIRLLVAEKALAIQLGADLSLWRLRLARLSDR
jgi:hypothetical protein